MPTLYCVASSSSTITYDGTTYKPTACGCRGNGHNLYRLPLSRADRERFRKAEWSAAQRGHRGRKTITLPSGKTVYASANPSCRELAPRADDEGVPLPLPEEPASSGSTRAARRGLPVFALRTVPRTDNIRKDILECNVCFDTAAGCKHHEDVLGGYPAPGSQRPIVVIGINPQDRGLAIYRAIQRLPRADKEALSDGILKAFARNDPNEPLKEIGVSVGDYTHRKHPGLSGWLPTVTRRLLGDDGPECRHILASRFRFIELYKHATRDEDELKALTNAPIIKSTCPQHAFRQIDALSPIGIICAGAAPLTTVAKVLASMTLGKRTSNALKVTDLHGDVFMTDKGIPLLITAANSRRSRVWDQRPTGTDTVRKVVSDWLGPT